MLDYSGDVAGLMELFIEQQNSNGVQPINQVTIRGVVDESWQSEISAVLANDVTREDYTNLDNSLIALQGDVGSINNNIVECIPVLI